MGNMGISHHKNVVADTGLVPFPAGTAHRNTLPEHAPVSDDRRGTFSFKLQILGHTADRSSREKFTVLPNCGVGMDHYMGADNTAIPHCHIMFDHRIWTDHYIVSNLRAFFNNRGFMNFTQWCNYRSHFLTPLQG